jgi:hypothetical protein
MSLTFGVTKRFLVSGGIEPAGTAASGVAAHPEPIQARRNVPADNPGDL